MPLRCIGKLRRPLFSITNIMQSLSYCRNLCFSASLILLSVLTLNVGCNNSSTPAPENTTDSTPVEIPVEEKQTGESKPKESEPPAPVSVQPAADAAQDDSTNSSPAPIQEESEDSSEGESETELEDSAGFSLNKKLTQEEEARLDAEIKKAQEFNEQDYLPPELTEEQKAELQSKQNQANSVRGDKEKFISVASESEGKTLQQQAQEDGAIGVEGDYPDEILDPKSPKYDWKIAVKAKPLPVDLGNPIVDNPDDLVRLHPEQNIWYDKTNKAAVVHGAVGLTSGPLELFACTGRVTRDRSFKDRVHADGPKAHESVLVFDIFPHLMHAALLASGAEPGKPAVFSPQFVPPTGTAVEVILRWKDATGKIQQAHAGDWIIDERTKETMKTPFVFTGSMFSVNRNGKRLYVGDVDGELICVSNFPSAVMDVPLESSAENSSRMYIANEAKIPPCGTPVTMILKPTDKKF